MNNLEKLVVRYKANPNMVNFVSLRREMNVFKRDLEDYESSLYLRFYEDEPEFQSCHAAVGDEWTRYYRAKEVIDG